MTGRHRYRLLNQHTGPARLVLSCLLFFLINAWSSSPAVAAHFDDADRLRLRVTITGLDKPLTRKVRKAISISRLVGREDLTVEEIQARHKRAEDEVLRTLESEGFYEAKVETSLTKRKNNWWVARYDVAPGEPVMINSVDVRIEGPGSDHTPLRELVDPFAIQAGERFRHKFYEQEKSRVLTRALRDGFLDARWTRHVVEVNRQTHQAAIILQLETGQRYRLGRIEVIQGVLRPEFVQKFILLNEGDFYSSAAILEQQNTLAATDYFSEVYVRPLKDQAVDYVVPIEIVMVYRKKNKYSLGVGFSTDTGIRGSLGWQRRLLNSRGHRLNTELAASKVGAVVGMRYRIPFRDPREDEYVITTSLSFFDPGTSQSSIARIGLARVVMRNRWRETLSLDYEGENFIVGQQDDQAVLLVPSANWLLQSPRRQAFVRKGQRMGLTVRGASDVLLSDVSFAQLDLNGKWIFPIGKRGRVFTRGNLAYTEVGTVFDLPASFRYFAGGDQSIRGFAFRSLGPVDDTGDVIGGRHIAVGSAEYVHRIAGQWSGAVFYDFGNSFNTLDELEVEQGAGVGVRWQTPIGAVRVDLASALSEPDRPWRLHFWIGPDL